MLRVVFGIVLVVAAAPLAPGQEVPRQPLPIVTLSLPSGITLQHSQIHYFMFGPFGGFGGYVAGQDGLPDVTIVAAVDGKPANEMKIIAYVPGCQIDTVDLAIQSPAVTQQLSCVPLGDVALRGQITPATIVEERPGRVEVTYLATWSHKFFGIGDGPVTAVRIATAVPDQDGNFEVAIPDFHAQKGLGEGEFQFILRERGTGNIIAILNPADNPAGPRTLKVQASYPPLTLFLAEFMP